MNDILATLSSYPDLVSPSTIDKQSSNGLSIAVTGTAEMFLLSNKNGSDSFLFHGSLRSSSKQTKQPSFVQPISCNMKGDTEASPLFKTSLDRVITNSDGNVIVVWSPKEIATVELEERSNSQKPRQYRWHRLDMDNLLSDSSATKSHDLSIVKIDFHPLSPYCIIILLNEKYVVTWDLRDVTTTGQQLHPVAHVGGLSGSSSAVKFSSFCTGPAVDWLQFTLFLLTTNGDIFALCPFLPNGIIISGDMLQSMKSWLTSLIQASTYLSVGNPQQQLLEYIKTTENKLKSMLGIDVFHQLNDFSSKNGLEDEDRDFIVGDDFNIYRYRSSLAKSSTGHTDYDTQLAGGVTTLLQGPLRILRSKDQTSEQLPRIVDIMACSPAARSAAAPCLFSISSNGLAEILMFDLMSEEDSFIAPAWRPIDRSRRALSVCSPRLLTSELFDTSSPDSNVDHNQWRLIQDPVYDYCFHAVDLKFGRGFMLSSAWLKQCLYECEQEENEGSEEEGKSSFIQEADEVEGVDDEEKNSSHIQHEKSLCMKTFDCNVELPGEVSSDSMIVSGVAVLKDPFVGHVCLIRLSTGKFGTVNLTVHQKLCQWRAAMKDDEQVDHTETIESSNLKFELRRLQSEDNTRWRRTEKLLSQVAEGLIALPKLEVIVNEQGVEDQCQRPKQLLETAHLLENKVINPLQELSQYLSFQFDLIDERLEVQRDILFGRYKEGKDSTRQVQLDGKTIGLDMGLQSLLQQQVEEHERLLERVKAIEKRQEQLKETANRCMQVAVDLRPKASLGEKRYREQLVKWSKRISLLSHELERLKVMAQERSKSREVPLSANNATKSIAVPLTATPTSKLTKVSTASPKPPTRSSLEPISVSLWSSARKTGPTTASKVTPSSHVMSPSTDRDLTTKLFLSPSPASLQASGPAIFQRHTTSSGSHLRFTDDEVLMCEELLDKQRVKLEACDQMIEKLEHRFHACKLSPN